MIAARRRHSQQRSRGVRKFFGLSAMVELLEAESDRRAALPARAPPDETRSEHDEPLVASGYARRVQGRFRKIRARQTPRFSSLRPGGGRSCRPYRDLVVAPYTLQRPLSQADKRIISLLCAVLGLLVLSGAIAAGCEDCLPSHPQGGIA
jgi:hypothetical protein